MDESYLRCCNILKELYKNIGNRYQLYNSSSIPFNKEAWKKEKAHYWIYGTSSTLEALELGRWLYYEPPLSRMARSQATKHYDAWEIDILERENEYFEFDPKKDLPKPDEKETLFNFLLRLEQLIEARKLYKKKQMRALDSFIAYLREDEIPEEVAFIEHIFPLEKELIKSLGQARIKKIVQPQEYRVSEKIAGDIIEELARMCICGNPKSLHNNIETLCLAWLCLTNSRIRLPIFLKNLHEMQLYRLEFINGYPELFIPTHFGDQKIRISVEMAQFFQAISELPRNNQTTNILQSPLSTLRRSLKIAIKNIHLPKDSGKITFLTFLSPPHCLGADIRYKGEVKGLKNKQIAESKSKCLSLKK